MMVCNKMQLECDETMSRKSLCDACHKYAFPLVVFVLLIAFFPPMKVTAKLPLEIQEIMAFNRPQLDNSLDIEEQMIRFAELLYPFDSFDDEPTLIIVSQVQKFPRLSLSIHKALEDVDYPFLLLKYGYAGYQYYGGDELFLRAKKEIITELQENFLRQLKIEDFNEILYRHLSFIEDGHFLLGNRSFRRAQSMYMNFDYDFLKDEHGYYLVNDTTREYLQQINGQAVAEFIKPSLDGNGRLVYRIGVLEYTRKEPLTVEVMLGEKASSRRLIITLEKVNCNFQALAAEDIYQNYTVEEIPVIAVRGFPYNEPQLEKFIEDAHHLRDKETIIIDLRYNLGGYSKYVTTWLDTFTAGAFPGSPPTFRVYLRTNIAQQLYEPFEERNLGFYRLGWSEISLPLFEQVPKHVKIVVLIDQWVASSGEDFIDHLRHLDNVVFLGMNTGGIYLVGNNCTTILPNSGLSFSFSTLLVLSSDLAEREGVGFLPDFWVHPDEALDLAVKFIHNYLQ